jgi:hypothetical protein
MFRHVLLLVDLQEEPVDHQVKVEENPPHLMIRGG